MTIYRYRIYDAPVDFIDCREVAEGFRSILRGWDVVEIPHDPAIPAFVTFRREKGIYDWNTPWNKGRNRRLDDPSRTVMEAVCDFHYEFIDWYAARNRPHFCVHMASVEFGGKAVLFPAVQKAGKSTLALHCAQSGFRLMGDDVVAVKPGANTAISLGLLPRMRLPLHPSFHPRFVDFIRSHAGLSDKSWQYVALDENEVLSHGEERDVAGIVILDRRPDVKAALNPAPASAAIKALVDRNFGQLEHPSLIFDSFKAMALNAERLFLTYSDPQAAVELLARAFGEPRSAGAATSREETDASA